MGCRGAASRMCLWRSCTPRPHGLRMVRQQKTSTRVAELLRNFSRKISKNLQNVVPRQLPRRALRSKPTLACKAEFPDRQFGVLLHCVRRPCRGGSVAAGLIHNFHFEILIQTVLNFSKALTQLSN